MLFEAAYAATAEQVRARNYGGALCTLRQFAVTAPTRRDVGLARVMEAEVLRCGFGRGLQVRNMLVEAVSILRPYPHDYAWVCLVGVAGAAQEMDLRQLRHWMRRLNQLNRRSRLPAWIMPIALGQLAVYLRGRCSWKAALAVLKRAHAQLQAVSDSQRASTIAIDAAWTAAQAGDVQTAKTWRDAVGADVQGSCWRDKLRAVDAEIHLFRRDLAGAAADLAGADLAAEDDAPLFVAITGLKLVHAQGLPWQQPVAEAFHAAAVRRQQWVVDPIHALTASLREEGAETSAAD